jgi:hypothetical protein
MEKKERQYRQPIHSDHIGNTNFQIWTAKDLHDPYAREGDLYVSIFQDGYKSGVRIPYEDLKRYVDMRVISNWGEDINWQIHEKVEEGT